MKHLKDFQRTTKHISLLGFCVCLYASSGSKHAGLKKTNQNPNQRLPAPRPSLAVLFCLRDRIRLVVIKGLRLLQISAIVATKRLDSGVYIKVCNWEACKLGKSVSCNFSDSEEGGW